MNNLKKRIDNLGRVVIPKQIRDELKIKEFDDLDIFLENESIVIKKSVGIIKYKDKLNELLKLVKLAYKFDVVILYENIVISSSHNDIEYNDKLFGLDCNILYKNIYKELYFNRDKKIVSYIVLDKLIIDSSIVGYILFLNNEMFNNNEEISNVKNLIISLLC